MGSYPRNPEPLLAVILEGFESEAVEVLGVGRGGGLAFRWLVKWCRAAPNFPESKLTVNARLQILTMCDVVL